MLTKLKIDKNKIAKALNIYIGGGGAVYFLFGTKYGG